MSSRALGKLQVRYELENSSDYIYLGVKIKNLRGEIEGVKEFGIEESQGEISLDMGTELKEGIYYVYLALYDIRGKAEEYPYLCYKLGTNWPIGG